MSYIVNNRSPERPDRGAFPALGRSGWVTVPRHQRKQHGPGRVRLTFSAQHTDTPAVTRNGSSSGGGTGVASGRYGAPRTLRSQLK